MLEDSPSWVARILDCGEGRAYGVKIDVILIHANNYEQQVEFRLEFIVYCDYIPSIKK